MKKIAFCALICLICLSSKAQNIAPRDNVLWDMNYYNPAMITRSTGIYADIYGRYDANPVKRDYVNPVDIAAETFYVRDNYCWQATLSHDGLSYFDATALSVAYSHRFDFGDNNNQSFRIGGRVILGYGRVDYSKLPYGMNGYNIMVRPDIDLGFDYRYKFFHIGMSIMNVMSLPIKDEDGIVYFRYPRAGLGHMIFDVNVCENFMLNPYFMAGLAQNFFIDMGLSMTIFKNYHLAYSFHGTDLAHNIGLAIDIADKVRIEGGYRIYPSHHNSALTLKLCVKLAD